MRSFLILISIVCFCKLMAQTKKIIVAQDGSGDFKTIQEALNAVAPKLQSTTQIFIKKGLYKEVIVVDATKQNIEIIGESRKETILSYNNHSGTKLANGDTLNTWTCASMFIYGNDIYIDNLTIENTAGFSAGQAVALRIEGNRVQLNNVNLIGNQDVLFLSGSGVKHYLNNCYIEGTTDFIFGAATAVFENCHIHSKKNSHITAASTNSIIPYGFVFLNCKLTANSNINKVSLGRPWAPTASVTYLNCWMDKHIIPQGWDNWRNPSNESQVRYAEYKSSGPGARPENRVKWSKQLTEQESEQFTLPKILGEWVPKKHKS